MSSDKQDEWLSYEWPPKPVDFWRNEVLRMRDAALIGYGALLALNADGRATSAIGTMALMLFGTDERSGPGVSIVTPGEKAGE